MRWFKPNLKSIHALFSGHPPSSEAETVLELGIEDIRDAMLALLEDLDQHETAHLQRRIRYALDVLGLWYLRGDLMALLAGRYGETGARDRIDPVSDMFRAMLPQGLRSRPSPLSCARE
ncbi:hypothetical protein [Ramlibacter sp.]|uniref:hypothetical protein n=1 Tax=Ramlibacter sp. TaxID=1917967 RepID=UPI002CE1A66C|nr:hypothetical protein [Ramlibacter sp.]HWI83170.1 hypothetical protein [Ramlibacter sp.]